MSSDRLNIYHTLFSHYLDPSLVVDSTTGEILECNLAAVRFLRLKRDQLLGLSLAQLASTDGDAWLTNFLEAIRVHGQVSARMILRIGNGGSARAEVCADSVDTPEGSLILLTLQGEGARGESGEGGGVQVAELTHRLNAIRELFYGLNNPIQELLSTLELKGNLRLLRVVEETTSILRQLRHIEKPTAPLVPADPTPRAGPRGAKPCTPGSILIVDDELSVRNLFHNILQRGIPNITLEMAGGGTEALAAFQQWHHEVILLDLSMPQVCGESVYVQLQTHCRLQHWQMPTIIICTGYDGSKTIQRVINEDPRHTYMFKPVPRDELITVVNRCLSRGVGV
jgi:CheY-like chemotaxis protein